MMTWEKLIGVHVLMPFAGVLTHGGLGLSHSSVEMWFSTLLLYQESVVAMPKSVLKELNTRIFNFFWAGKKACVALKGTSPL